MAESPQTTAPRAGNLLSLLMSAALLIAIVGVTAGWAMFLVTSLLKVLGL